MRLAVAPACQADNRSPAQTCSQRVRPAVVAGQAAGQPRLRHASSSTHLRALAEPPSLPGGLPVLGDLLAVAVRSSKAR